MNRALRLMTEFYCTPWALMPETLAVMQALLNRWASGEKLGDDQIRAAIGDAPEASATRRERERASGGDLIAVIPVFGVIGHRAHLVEGLSSGVNTSTEILGQQIRAALADPAIAAIVLDVDSPGGSVFGVGELADLIYSARSQKEIVASINSLAASAGYWIASAASRVYITPGGMAGSIGVWSAHEDWSKALELKGVKTTLISAGKYKVENNPYEPLTEEGRDAEQQTVNKYYGLFTKSVARHRNAGVADVRNGYGEGRVLLADDAIKANLADEIATFDEVIGGLSKRLARQRSQGAVAQGSASHSAAMARRKIDLASL
jgi:signal peptide peptidase SppA